MRKIAIVSAWRGLVVLLGVIIFLAACQPVKRPQREMFDSAEKAYRDGNYLLARERYEVFRKTFPEHQLASLAEQRIVNIKRELQTVMKRKYGSKPINLRPVSAEESSQDSGGIVRPLPPR